MRARIVCKTLPEVSVVHVDDWAVNGNEADKALVATVGIDLSLAGTGVAIVLDGKLHSAKAWTDRKTLQPKYRRSLCWFKMKHNTEPDRQHRIDLMANWVIGRVLEAAKLASQYVVALEGWAFSKRTTGLSDMHELGGVIKEWLWSRGIPFRTYDPMSIKLAWTGRGDAEKKHMVVAVRSRYPSLDKVLSRLWLDNEDAAGNLADATLIAALLYEEVALKLGRRRLDRIGEPLRRVMLRTTKASPEALISRGFIAKEEASPPEPVFAL